MEPTNQDEINITVIFEDLKLSYTIKDFQKLTISEVKSHLCSLINKEKQEDIIPDFNKISLKDSNDFPIDSEEDI